MTEHHTYIEKLPTWARHTMWLLLLLVVVGCSTTSNLPEGDILYTGIKATAIHDKKNTYEESVALTEVEAALAYAPNNSFMGSSSIRTPLPIGLWIHNSMINKEHSKFGQWMLNTFGSNPITIQAVNPATRTKVASNTLQNYGYFNGYVDYELIDQRNPRKQKIKYDIYLGEPYHYDSIQYNFRGHQRRIIDENAQQSYLRTGGQFSVPDLQMEKERLTTDFRNNGYYYYRSDYIRYFADSVHAPQKVWLRIMPDIDMPDRANHQWHIGNISTFVRKNRTSGAAAARRTPATPADSTRNATATPQQRTQGASRAPLFHYDDTLQLDPYRTYAYEGEKPPVRHNILFKNFRIRHGQLFRQDNVDQTITNLSGMQVFSKVQFTFTPRDSTLSCDTLDVRVDATMDKLIDSEFNFSFTQKSNSQIGPNASVRLSKRNAFGHGETFSVGLKGSYEWQVGNQVNNAGSRPDSWEAGVDASLSYPWIVFPGLYNHHFTYSASSIFHLSIDNLNRAGYYRLVSFGTDATYYLQTSRRVTHQITPLTLTYNHLIDTSARFDSITAHNSALYASMRDQFIPAMQYVYTYDNSATTHGRMATRLVVTAKEAGNLLSTANAILGHSWHQTDKKLLGTPYSQFFKINVELVNKFKVFDKSELAMRVQVGSIFTYANSRFAPYSELFFVGGANSIRAFGARTIGPGRYYDRTGRGTYLDQAGDFKVEANAEYRFNLVSNLNAAFFIDAGNVWTLRDDHAHPQGKIGSTGLIESIALGTGFGFRYDLEFLVLRLDLGIGIHAPYDTGKSGYYNIPKFTDGLGFHFAVGYPF